MSATVYSLWTGEPVGPATLEAMHWKARQAKWARDAELIRQIDELVEAYRFAYADLLPQDTISPLVEGLPDAP